MDKLVQQDRPIGVKTAFGTDVLVLTAFNGSEALSNLFSFDLQMISLQASLDPKKILGTSVSFWIRHQDGTERWFNGIVNSFTYAGSDDRLHHYHAHVVPKLWLLTRGSDCAVHETGKTQDAKDIADKLLKKLGVTSVEWRLKRTLEKRDYCIQYRETHFDFVSRLLEEEGIYYYFLHSENDHKLILTDHKKGVYEAKDGSVSLRNNLAFVRDHDYLKRWNHEYDYTAGTWSTSDYNFETPKTKLVNTQPSKISLSGNTGFEFYDFPGGFGANELGKTMTTLRIEEEECAHDTVSGNSICRSFSPGASFSVKEHHIKSEEGKSFVLTAVQHFAKLSGSYTSGVVDSSEIYSNTFCCIPADIVFRPARVRCKPRVLGLHSAVVTGPAGEEIYTDKYGRIRIQFPWDRVGKDDENSSMWVRVSTPWAGTNWGMIQIPRIGQEVLVSFLEGDPDRPVVTGMMYNADNMPPYTLPANQTQSGIKTRSSKKGTDENFNEIRFEDKKDSEEIYVHAEKDFNCVIENDETRKVGFEKSNPGNQTIDIYNDQILNVGKGSEAGSQTIEIAKNRTVTLKTGDDSLTINKGNMTVSLKMGNQSTKLDLGSSTTEAMQSIELTVGSNSIKIDQTGIVISGMQVTVEGTLKADLTSPMTTVNGDGMVKIAGGVAMIN